MQFMNMKKWQRKVEDKKQQKHCGYVINYEQSLVNYDEVRS